MSPMSRRNFWTPCRPSSQRNSLSRSRRKRAGILRMKCVTSWVGLSTGLTLLFCSMSFDVIMQLQCKTNLQCSGPKLTELRPGAWPSPTHTWGYPVRICSFCFCQARFKFSVKEKVLHLFPNNTMSDPKIQSHYHCCAALARNNAYDGVQEFWITVRETAERTTETSYEELQKKTTKAPDHQISILKSSTQKTFPSGLAAGDWRSNIPHGWNQICCFGRNGDERCEGGNPCLAGSKTWSLCPGLPG